MFAGSRISQVRRGRRRIGEAAGSACLAEARTFVARGSGQAVESRERVCPEYQGSRGFFLLQHQASGGPAPEIPRIAPLGTPARTISANGPPD